MESSLLQHIILGIVQGITELLPISSTAHLALVPWFLGWQDPGLSLTVALHGGTLLAVLIYFWRDWMKMAQVCLHALYTRSSQSGEEKLLLLIVIATIPGALAGYFLEDYAETIFRSPLLIAGALAGFSFVIIAAEKLGKQTMQADGLSLRKALFIGLLQACAIIPGVSRSGATISGGLFAGLRRAEAARFSFLMSAPIIAGALFAMLPEIIAQGLVTGAFFAGITSAFLSGLAAIAFLMRFVQLHTLWVFVYYRLILAGIIVIFFFIQ